jgi:hypothetical protein
LLSAVVPLKPKVASYNIYDGLEGTSDSDNEETGSDDEYEDEVSSVL